MTPKYKNVRYAFNKAAWQAAIAAVAAAHGNEFVAEILEVNVTTVHGWINMKAASYGRFPHPSMSNFIAFCSTFDVDPRGFWTTED